MLAVLATNCLTAVVVSRRSHGPIDQSTACNTTPSPSPKSSHSAIILIPEISLSPRDLDGTSSPDEGHRNIETELEVVQRSQRFEKILKLVS